MLEAGRKSVGKPTKNSEKLFRHVSMHLNICLITKPRVQSQKSAHLYEVCDPLNEGRYPGHCDCYRRPLTARSNCSTQKGPQQLL